MQYILFGWITNYPFFLLFQTISKWCNDRNWYVHMDRCSHFIQYPLWWFPKRRIFIWYVKALNFFSHVEVIVIEACSGYITDHTMIYLYTASENSTVYMHSIFSCPQSWSCSVHGYVLSCPSGYHHDINIANRKFK